ncbi:RmlC-like cupin domain-containing protein [Mycena rosella]|uniref:RmlC-like cupin domain-containing protein n=1 Tax=Mycena rosella TaxID=1033263 RepID=A0AAD7GBJ9_MYCRO|nr:RmlC-like cupin domain-containing protein [Mycena rosella]
MFFAPTVLVAVLAAVFTVHAAPTMTSPAPVPTVTNATQIATATSPGPVPTVTNAVEIAEGLRQEPSIVDRFNKLLKDDNGNLLTGDALRQLTVFDFNLQTPAPGAKGGSILLATVDDFPILEELGISGAVSFIEPCGLNIPHLHPRASEILTVIEGILDTGFVQENGFNTVATVFPMGSMHYQQNPTCSPAAFVAGLSSEDPGRSDIALSFWMLPSDIVNATLGFPNTIGGGNIDEWRAHLPVNLAAGVDSCLQACGLSE